jgi:hypothetical protein
MASGPLEEGIPSLETVPLYSDIFRTSGTGGDNMAATPKTDHHDKRGRRPRAPPKEEATFDTELQRYVMPSERAIKHIQKKDE